MIQWRISQMPDGHCALTFRDSGTGDGFIAMFSSARKLTETMGQIIDQVDGLERLSCSLEGMSMFVEAFPEMF